MEEQVNILVLDDEKVMLDLLGDVLSGCGYNIEKAASSGEAVEMVRNGDFSIVITDLSMPGLNGTEILNKLKAINSDICVIIMTAYPSIESVVNAMRSGAYDYIVKPFNIEEIKLVINRAIERQHLLQEAGKKEFYKELSILDGLTGVYNHRHFYEVLSREIERAKRYNHQLCLLMADLDDFKGYNDSHGHLGGDKLLRSFAELFVRCVRCADMIFRYGGDEFAVIYPETTKDGCWVVAKRLLNVVESSMPIAISIGISCFPQDTQDRDDLVKKADEALYQAKQLGKNRVCVFEKAQK